MPVFGVICEYDPFHLGHRWMLEQLRQQGPVVCAMSGCFTQRGEFAAVNKFARAEMAVRNGADLVLELPTPWAVSGAERFARGGVELLQKAGVVTHLAFGSECGDLEALRRVEACLSGGAYQDAVRQRLEGGETFARCRQLAVEKLLGPQDAALLAQPNNILAIEYLKALRRADFPMEPVTFPRRGGQHDGPVMEGIAPASHIRRLLRTGTDGGGHSPSARRNRRRCCGGSWRQDGLRWICEPVSWPFSPGYGGWVRRTFFPTTAAARDCTAGFTGRCGRRRT